MIVDILSQLLDAVAYLHNRGLVHADIKLENVLLFQVSLFLFRELLSYVILDMFIKQFQKRSTHKMP